MDRETSTVRSRLLTVAICHITCALFLHAGSIECSFACDTCGTSSAVQVPGLLSSLRTTVESNAQWTASVQEQFSTFSVDASARLQTANEKLSLVRALSVTQLSLGFSPSATTSLQIGVPIVARRYERFQRFARTSNTEVGIGDSTILGTYAPVSISSPSQRVYLGVVGGIKLPTGDPGSLKSAARSDDFGGEVNIQGRGLSLGSGSVDLPLGAVVYLREGRGVFLANGLYTVRGEGAADYRFAEDIAWNAAPGWMFVLGEEETLTLSLSLSGEHKGLDHLQGAAVSNTSSNNLYAGPDLFYSLSNQLSLQLAFELPLSIDVGNAAIEPETRSRCAVMWRF